MGKILIEIRNDGAKCGRCAVIRYRRYGDGHELPEPLCKVFGKWLSYCDEDRSINRLHECIAAEEGYHNLITEIF